MSQLEEFRALGLSEDMIKAVSKKGFETPSPIQTLTIPHLLTSERDIIAQAQTGTGKTAAFGLPIIQMLTTCKAIPQAIVLVPTRELALQVTGELLTFNTNNLSIASIYGGASIEEQLRRLKKGIDIVVGTPGRILDHIRRRTLNLSEISFLVLDEADEMLNMGFIEDIEDIMREMTSPKRVLLFSATMPARIAALAKKYMNEPELLKVESKNVTTELTNQIYFEVREGDKFDALTRIIDVEPEFYGIVFSRTKVGCDDIVNKLIERGYAAEGLHGDISQAQREKILNKFKKKKVNILIATDVAARGIDVNNLTHVINYSLPQDSDSYVHRIGRTGRAGNQGTAITFISSSEMRQFGFLKREIKADIKLEKLPTPADVIATKRNKIKEDLYNIVESENYKECGDMAAELLERYAPDVALSALLRLAFKNELTEGSYPEIRSINVDRKGKARIFIAVGFKDGYEPRKLVALLKRECGLSDHDIDDIKIMEDFSFVTVPFDQANKVVRALNMLSEGRPIAEIAKDKTAGDAAPKKEFPRHKKGGDDTASRSRAASYGGDKASAPRRKKEAVEGDIWDKGVIDMPVWKEGKEKPVRKKDVMEMPVRKRDVMEMPYRKKGGDDVPSRRKATAFGGDSASAPRRKKAVGDASWKKDSDEMPRWKKESGSFSSARKPKAKAKKTTAKVSRRERKESGRRK